MTNQKLAVEQKVRHKHINQSETVKRGRCTPPGWRPCDRSLVVSTRSFFYSCSYGVLFALCSCGCRHYRQLPRCWARQLNRGWYTTPSERYFFSYSAHTHWTKSDDNLWEVYYLSSIMHDYLKKLFKISLVNFITNEWLTESTALV